MSSDFFQSELTWALAIPAEAGGRQNFSCFLCETAGVDGCCYVVMYNVKTVRTCSSTCFSDRQAPRCDMAAPVCSSTRRSLCVLGPAVGCLGTASLPVDLAPSFSIPPLRMGCALIPAPATFFPPLIPFCSSCTSPSLCLRCTTIIFLLSFLFFTTSAYRISLSLFQGNPSHSFFAAYYSPFITTLFSRTLFGNLLDSSSYSKIDYTFILQLRPARILQLQEIRTRRT